MHYRLIRDTNLFKMLWCDFVLLVYLVCTIRGAVFTLKAGGLFLPAGVALFIVSLQFREYAFANKCASSVQSDGNQSNRKAVFETALYTSLQLISLCGCHHPSAATQMLTVFLSLSR